jgi:hypothetical protein
MDIILLRKLSYKSVIGFGKHAEMTVQQLIDLNHTYYLIWLYFNVAGISFIDEILNDLFWDDKWKIEKPGINIPLCEEFMSDIDRKYRAASHGVEGTVKRKINLGRNRAERINYNKRVNLVYHNKGLLQAKNQGH